MTARMSTLVYPLGWSMDHMALLVADSSRVEGPQGDLLHILFGALVATLRDGGMSELDADNLAMRALVRIQARLAGAGYIIRDIG
jgi:hypothetical protein